MKVNHIYYTGYPTEPSEDGNPYYRCIYCKRTDPAINGRLEGHLEDCAWVAAVRAGVTVDGYVPTITELLAIIKEKDAIIEEYRKQGCPQQPL